MHWSLRYSTKCWDSRLHLPCCRRGCKRAARMSFYHMMKFQPCSHGVSAWHFPSLALVWTLRGSALVAFYVPSSCGETVGRPNRPTNIDSAICLGGTMILRGMVLGDAIHVIYRFPLTDHQRPASRSTVTNIRVGPKILNATQIEF